MVSSIEAPLALLKVPVKVLRFDTVETSLMALGMILIFKTTDVVNFAQADMTMFSTFVGYAVLTGLHWPFALALPAAILADVEILAEDTAQIAEREEDGAAAAPDAVVIWLHGLGADGYDFEPVVPELRLPARLRVRFVFPHAPRRAVTLNLGLIMPAWYDIISLAPDTRAEGPEGLAAVLDVLQIPAFLCRQTDLIW